MEISKALFKLKKAQINIQKSQPFYAYLSLFLRFKEVKCDTKWEDGGLGAGVDIKGNFSYNPDFIESLSEENVKWLLLHEISHICFLHHTRLGNRNKEVFNIASDVVVNSLLQQNGFRGIDGAIIPNHNHEVELFKDSPHKQIIKDCEKKNAEQVYDEIKIPKEFQKEFYVVISGKEKSEGEQEGEEQNKGKDDKEQLGKGSNAYGKTGYKQIDKHFYEDGNLSEEEKRKLEKEWIQRVQEAYVQAQMRGVVPNGVERIIGNLHESKIGWKALLYKHITSFIPSDYCYQKPSKKSVASGFYLPDTIKDRISVVCAVDTSGSIGEQELIDFISEIVGIAKAFRNKINMTFISADCEVNGVWEVENGNVEKIKKCSIKGGGGTSHICVFNHIQEKIKDCRVAVFLTDGQSDLNEIDFNKFKFEKIFVLSKGGSEEQLKDKKCRIIKL